MSSRTAREVVELYNLVVWNERDFELANDLFAETVIRHEVEQAVDRVRRNQRREY